MSEYVCNPVFTLSKPHVAHVSCSLSLVGVERSLLLLRVGVYLLSSFFLLRMASRPKVAHNSPQYTIDFCLKWIFNCIVVFYGKKTQTCCLMFPGFYTTIFLEERKCCTTRTIRLIQGILRADGLDLPHPAYCIQFRNVSCGPDVSDTCRSRGKSQLCLLRR